MNNEKLQRYKSEKEVNLYYLKLNFWPFHEKEAGHENIHIEKTSTADDT